MKKALSVLLALALLLSVFTVLPFTASAAEADVAAVAQSGTTGDCTWTFANGVLTISGSGNMGNYSGSDSRPWQDLEIAEVIINKGVTTIGRRAFSGFNELRSVTIPDSVRGIGESAFDNCSALQSVTIPDSVTAIGQSAFCNCEELKSATLSSSINKIAEGLFAGCRSLTSIIIPGSVTEIGGYAFEYSGLTSLTIPDSVTEIGFDALRGCSGLTSVTIPDSVTEIGRGAFRGCSGLKSIQLPKDLTVINSYSFAECTGLTSFNIPNAVKKIDEVAFADCTGLTNVTIPDSVQTIEGVAFTSCPELKNVAIPDTVHYIGERAFGYTIDEMYGDVVKVSGFTITGYKGSGAQRYAEKNGFQFNELATCAVTFDLNGTGELVVYHDDDHEEDPGVQYLRPGRKAVQPELYYGSDWIFDGWYTDKACTMKYDFNTPVNSDLTLYAKWLSIYCTVTIIPSTTDYGTYTIDVERGRPLDDYFAHSSGGWDWWYEGIYTDKAMTKPYDQKAPINSDLTLYEKYVPGHYTVTIIPNVSSFGTFSMECGRGELFRGGVPITSSEWIYDGLYTDKAMTEKFDFNTPITSDLTLYGKWVKASNSSASAQLATPKITKLENTAAGVRVTYSESAGAVKYRVFRKAGSGSFAKLADTTALTYVDKTAKSGTKYAYTVRCISKDGKKYTSDYNKTGKSILYLAQPKITKFENVANGIKLTLSKSAGAASYKVFIKSGKAWKQLATVKTNTYTYTKVKSGTTYTFTVRAVDKSGKTLSAYNTTGWKQKFVASPALPTLKNTKNGIQVTIKKVAGAEKYRIFRKVGNGKFTKLADTTKLTYVDKTAKNGKTYSYTIRCISKDGKTFTSAYNTKGKAIKCKR